MYIIQLASELAPIAKVGGLGDVILGLSRELSNEHNVEIILPKYECINTALIKNFHVELDEFISYYGGQRVSSSVWSGQLEGLKLFLIDVHTKDNYFNREFIYGYQDDAERFTCFSLFALEFILQTKRKPNILHIHDWQTAIAAVLYKDIYKPDNSSVVLTIHNMEYQGHCGSQCLDNVGLDSTVYNASDKFYDMNSSCVNLIKGGIVYSDFVTTVSPNYAWEVLTPEGGKGLSSTLTTYSSKFKGIINGLDYSIWNPGKDPFIKTTFSKHDRKADLFYKKNVNKLDLRSQYALKNSLKPLVACITRLVPQKGINLIKHAIHRTIEKDGQFILLGTSPISEIENEFIFLKNQFMGNPNVCIELINNEILAHKIYAGADLFIVPSLFEPCGLTPLIALKYGTIPIVRKTGGLADTICDVSVDSNKMNGYSFYDPTEDGLNSALDRALTTWFEEPSQWQELVLNAMRMDFSWEKPAKLYVEIFNNLIMSRTLE